MSLAHLATMQRRAFSVVGSSAWNDLPVELRSLLMACPSKFYISLKSFFGLDWDGSIGVNPGWLGVETTQILGRGVVGRGVAEGSWTGRKILLFIHSFILNIYIAPLQEDYSEALPTPARLKEQS